MIHAESAACASLTRDLQFELERALSAHVGAGRRILRLDRRPSAYRTSFALEELAVELDDGTRLDLVFKDLSRGTLAAGAGEAKPAFLYDPLREIEAYRKLLTGAELGTATCYGAVVAPDRERYWLFLEKVRGVELWQVGAISTWATVARWLAAMHERLGTERQRSDATARLVRYDAEFFRLWPQRALGFSAEDRRTRRWLAWLASRYEEVVERLLALPATVIHGEFYASNVLVAAVPGAMRVCPVDWEVAALGPALVDLAALTAGRWTDEQRTAIARAYHGALGGRAATAPSEPVLLEDLKLCRLHLAVQWLGWSPTWSPPAEHAHGWLEEARRLAEELGL